MLIFVLRRTKNFNNFIKFSSISLTEMKANTSKAVKNRKHIAVSYEDDNNEETEVEDKKKSKTAPKNWEIIFKNIKQMRLEHKSPVDTMGCEQCADKKASPANQRFQILVALMLSAQTRDEVTFAACQRLKEYGFTPENIANADQNKLEELLKPVGFYRTKAKHIKQTSQILIDQYNSDVPNDLNKLLKLPGIGKKMANIALADCWNNIVGIGVDVHVHRISNRLNWVDTKTPEKTQDELESWLPRNYWQEVNLMLVGFGQTVCTPKNPKCGECLNNKLCPSAFKEQNEKKNKKKNIKA